MSASVGDIGATNTEESRRRRDREICGKTEVGKVKVKVTDCCSNVSSCLAESDKTSSDTDQCVDDKSSRLAARVSRYSETKTENEPRRHQKRITSKYHRQATDCNVEYRETGRVQLGKADRHKVGEDASVLKSALKRKPARGKASAKTTVNVDDLGDTEDAGRVNRDNRRYRVDGKKLSDKIRLLAAPILAAEVRRALAEIKHPLSSPEVVGGHLNPSSHCAHHRHQHPKYPHQTEGCRPWHQTAKIMAQPRAVKFSSYNENRPVLAPPDFTGSTVRCPLCARRRRPAPWTAGQTPGSAE